MSDTESSKNTNNKGENKACLIIIPSITNASSTSSRGSYMPRDLMNFSVKTFCLREDDDLSLRHEDARKGFTGTFLQSRSKFDEEHEGDKILNAQMRNINNLRIHIDNFFFVGQLRDHLDVDFGMDVVAPTEDGSAKEGGNGYTVLSGDLRVNIGSKNQIFPLMTIAETLVYEMAHAYLMLFSAWNCEKCDGARLSTIDLPGDGHGLIF
ncbi:hypothetical protein DL769_004452 [Monosporascus sp. CRB-8-3]|nr:hypothetical protein DL769_004452 [Monosporascus sp. CRB-8-3]